jgi:pimeloyl-ACP methyl ester carboxylesterase
MPADEPYSESYLDVDGVRTHYLEAGREHDETLLLLHSGEFGASAAFSWAPVIGPLAEEFHVLAPDMIGYGHTEKLFSFEDQFDLRVSHVGDFLDTLCVDSTHVIGNSLGGGDVLSVLSEDSPQEWPIERAVSVSGGGGPPEAFGDVLREFDGSPEAMTDVLDLLYHEQWWDDAYLDRRVAASRIPGQWQATAAIRFDAPFELDRTFRRVNDYENIATPTLVVAGAEDRLKSVEKMRSVYEAVARGSDDARFEVFEGCAHCSQVERPEAFVELVTEFLTA